MPVNREYYLNGAVILIDKEFKWTSFDVVKKIRNITGVRKVGHAGTLDPLATGLLIICTGKKTKEIHYFQDLEKEYTGTFILGATRPSHDKETEIVDTFPLEDITNEKLYNIAQQFIGEIEQRPPSFSAIRKGGRRLYEFARQGELVKAEPRAVKIHKFEITNIHLPKVSFRLKCSKGFYVRSLARDFGIAAGCGAYLDSLRRTAIGDHTVDEAMTMENFVRTVQEINMG